MSLNIELAQTLFAKRVVFERARKGGTFLVARIKSHYQDNPLFGAVYTYDEQSWAYNVTPRARAALGAVFVSVKNGSRGVDEIPVVTAIFKEEPLELLQTLGWETTSWVEDRRKRGFVHVTAAVKGGGFRSASPYREERPATQAEIEAFIAERTEREAQAEISRQAGKAAQAQAQAEREAAEEAATQERAAAVAAASTPEAKAERELWLAAAERRGDQITFVGGRDGRPGKAFLYGQEVLCTYNVQTGRWMGSSRFAQEENEKLIQNLVAIFTGHESLLAD